jgi:hypothetical protein
MVPLCKPDDHIITRLNLLPLLVSFALDHDQVSEGNHSSQTSLYSYYDDEGSKRHR